MNQMTDRWVGMLFCFLWGATLTTAALCDGTFIPETTDLSPSAKPEFQLEATEERVRATVQFLSSDAMEGRSLGRPGLELTRDYIVENFTAAGLKTDLWDGKPLQTFRVSDVWRMSPNESTFLRFDTGGQTLDCRTQIDCQPMLVGGNGTFAGGIAFVGYGITASGDGWSYDEYAGIDVQGKVVIVLRKEPQQADANSVFEGQSTTKHSFFETKIRNAMRHGAAAILFVNDFVSAQGISDQPEGLPAIEAAGKRNESLQFPTFFITRTFLQQLFDATNSQRKLIDLEQQIETNIEPQSFELQNLQVAGAIELGKQEVSASNVVGVLPGSGEFSSQAIVIGAHYDHVGMGEYGSLANGVYAVHNGADDNASGTSALIEIAKRFGETKSEHPANYRQLVFIGFSAEERGLLGSKHYVQHPVVPLEQTIVMLNMDMVGRMSHDKIIVYGTGSASIFSDLVTRRAQAVGLTANQQVQAMGPSDHQPFFERNVPVLHFFTGIHSQYHRPSDDFEKINTTGIARITDMIYQMIDELAKRPDRPSYIRVPGRANIQIATEDRGRLGIRLSSASVAATVSEVLRGGAAAEAGIEVGDVIVAIDTDTITETSKFIDLVAAHAPGDTLTLRVQRAEKILEIPVQLGHY